MPCLPRDPIQFNIDGISEQTRAQNTKTIFRTYIELKEGWIQTDKNQANQNLAEIVSLVFVQTQGQHFSKHKNDICRNTRTIFAQTQEQYLSKPTNSICPNTRTITCRPRCAAARCLDSRIIE